MRPRLAIRRVHVWLGWLVAVPLLFWTASGLFMASFPIEQVRGTHLRVEAVPVDARNVRLPSPAPDAATRMMLVSQGRRPVWLVTNGQGRIARYDGRSGLPIGAVTEAEAGQFARGAYAPAVALQSVTFHPASAPPRDLRRARPSWQASFADGADVYIDAESGEILALRTRLWRAYDWMWGLHIMDLQEREATHHVSLYGFAALAVAGVLSGVVLLPLVRRRRGRR